jgi:hypothetical protein
VDLRRRGHTVTFHGEVVYHISTPPKPAIAFTLPAVPRTLPVWAQENGVGAGLR